MSPANLSSLWAAVSRTNVVTPVSFTYGGLSDEDEQVLLDYANERSAVQMPRQSTPYTCGAMVATVLKHPDPEFWAEHDIEQAEAETYDRLHAHSWWPHSWWPRRWGTTPWALAHELSTDELTYQSVPINDASESGWASVQWAFHAACLGYPSALYTGDSLESRRRTVGNIDGIGTALAGAVPRHVIGVLPGDNYTADGIPQLTIYEPSVGGIYHVPLHIMMEGTTSFAPFGEWSHIVWAVLPSPKNP